MILYLLHRLFIFSKASLCADGFSRKHTLAFLSCQYPALHKPQIVRKKKYRQPSNQYQFILYCSQIIIGRSSKSQVLAAVCCGKLLKETSDDDEDDLPVTVGSISLDCNDKKECKCECHEMYSGSDSESD